MSETTEKVPVARRRDGTFAPGRSGNPRGRPPRIEMAATTQGLCDATIAILQQLVPMRVNNRTMRVPMIQAVLHALVKSALNGHARSAKQVVELYKECCSVHEQRFTDSFRTALAVTESLAFDTKDGEIDPVRIEWLNKYRRRTQPRLALATTDLSARRSRRANRKIHDETQE